MSPLGIIERWTAAVSGLREALPDVPLATVRPREEGTVAQAVVVAHVDLVLQSFEEALAFVAPRHGERR